MKRFLPKSEFGRNVLTLMTGTVIAQAIPVVLAPFLTRIYTPEDFGVLAVYLAIIGIISIVITARYELAIVLPRSNKAAIGIFSASIYIALITCIILTILLYFFWEALASLLNKPDLSYWLYLLPAIGLITGLQQILIYWRIRQKKFKLISVSKVIHSITTSLSQILIGLASIGFKGLIIGYILGLTISTLSLLNKNNIHLSFNKARTFLLLKKYIKFPTFNLANALFDAFRNSLITFIISSYFGLYQLGLYMLAWRMLALPVSLISASISEPYYQKIATLSAKETHDLTWEIIRKLTSTSIFIYLFIFLFAPNIFELFFGKEWEASGEIASIMTPWIFMSFISSPLAHVYSRYNKQNLMLYYSFTYMLIPIATLSLLRNGEILTALLATSLSMSVFLLFYIYKTLDFLKKHHV